MQRMAKKGKENKRLQLIAAQKRTEKNAENE